MKLLTLSLKIWLQCERGPDVTPRDQHGVTRITVYGSKQEVNRVTWRPQMWVYTQCHFFYMTVHPDCVIAVLNYCEAMLKQLMWRRTMKRRRRCIQLWLFEEQQLLLCGFQSQSQEKWDGGFSETEFFRMTRATFCLWFPTSSHVKVDLECLKSHTESWSRSQACWDWVVALKKTKQKPASDLEPLMKVAQIWIAKIRFCVRFYGVHTA